MLNCYSVVIQPDDPDIIRFKFYKDKLSNTIGNYGSRNSMAHITILEFDATEKELFSIVGKLNKIAREEMPFDAIFDQVVYSKTLLVLPDKDVDERFKKLLQKVRARIRGKNNNSSAHISIGRELTPEQIENSQNLFPDFHFNFHCDQLALRKRNGKVGQYDIVQTFLLSGVATKEESIQLSMF